MPKTPPDQPGGKGDDPVKDLSVKSAVITKTKIPPVSNALKNFQPRKCQCPCKCAKLFKPTSSRGVRCESCKDANHMKELGQTQDAEMENYVSMESLIDEQVIIGTPADLATKLEEKIRLLEATVKKQDDELQKKNNKITELQQTNDKLRIKVANLTLELDEVKASKPTITNAAPAPKQSYANAVFPSQTINQFQTIILQPTELTDRKLDNQELIVTKKKLEAELEKKAIKINARKIVAANQGKIIIDLYESSDKKEVIKQLNEIATKTGFSAVDVPKRRPRLVIKDVPSLFVPEDPEEIVELIKAHNPSVKDLLSFETESLRHVITTRPKRNGDVSIVLESTPNLRKVMISHQKVRLGMCVYEISDHFRVIQCNKCMKFGHLAKFCRQEHSTCGICNQRHPTRECDHSEARRSDKLAYMNNPHKSCSNCSNQTRYKQNAPTHGALDLNMCPVYKNQLTRVQERTDFGATPINT
jgi:uncharacterized coiled-coil protein SlyX